MAEIVVKLVNGELAGKTAQTIAKEVNAAALALKKAEVGTQAWVDANKKLEDAKQLQGDLKKQIEGTASASDLLKKAWNGLPGAGFFNQIGASLGMAKSGVGGLISSMGMLKGAIAATGIGLLVLAVASLVGWFTKTDAGATKLDGIMRGLGNVIDVLWNRIINLKETLIQLFTQPGQFFKGLFTDIKEGIKLGDELAETFDALDERRRQMEFATAGTEAAVQKLLLQSKNVALTYQERLDLLARADSLEKASHENRIAYQREMVGALEREAAFALKNGTITDEQRNKVNEARIEMIRLEQESINLQEKIENRRSQLLEKQDAERERAYQAELKRKEELRKKELEQLATDNAVLENLRKLENEKKLLEIDDLHAREMEKLNQQTEEKILALQGNEMQIFEQTKILREIQGLEMQAIDDKYAKIKADADQKAADKAVADAKKEADEKKRIAQEEFDFKRSLQDAQLGLASTALGATVTLLGEDEKARKKNADAIRAFSIAQIVVDTQREIAGYYANPASTGTLGAVGTAKALGAIIRAGLAIAKVNAQKFDVGGPVYGPRHSGGGVPIEAEGGEFIFSRKAVQAIGMPTLSALNNRYTFATGGPVMPEVMMSGASGGSAAARGGDPFAAMERLEKTFMMYAERVDSWQKTLTVNNNLQDTKKGLETLNTLQNEWNV